MKVIENIRSMLGESPIWSEKDNCFFWVDILGKKILSVDEFGNDFKLWHFEQEVCAIAEAISGQYLVAFRNQLAFFEPDSGMIQFIDGTKLSSEQEMFNDGCFDECGRFWIGTKDINEKSGLGQLYCFDGEQLRSHDTGFIVSNGIDWSPDNRYMYLADSPKQVIYRYDYDIETGHISDRIEWVTVSNGFPDGACMDKEGNLWSAHWDGFGLSCYDKQGRVKFFSELPAQRVTSCCFGGKDKNKLFITTAAHQLETLDNHNGHAFILEILQSAHF